MVPDGSAGSAIFLVIALIGLVLIAIELKGRMYLNNWLKQAEASNQLEVVFHDFENGAAFFDSHLRMGLAYIFVERMGRIYEYSEITEVRLQSAVMSNRTINHQLVFKMVNGKHPAAFVSSSFEAVEYEYAMIIQQIQAHNPNIKIGKHKKTYN